MTTSSIAVTLVAAVALTARAHASGCCGNGGGGDAPIVLYPGEAAKVYVGLARQAEPVELTAAGEESKTGSGPTSVSIAQVAGAVALSEAAYAAVSVPYLTNANDERASSAAGDPAASVHWTPYRQTMARPWLPQAQLVAGYKRSVARSPYTARDEDTLDVVSSGFDEARAGYDLWFGLTRFKLDLAQSVAQPLSRAYDGVTYEPGRIVHTTLLVGADVVEDELTVLGGVGNDTGQTWKSDGVTVDDSDSRNNALLANVVWSPRPRDTVRLSLARRAAFGGNKTSVRTSELGLGFARAF